MPSFRELRKNAADWITVFDDPFYPDFLDSAIVTYGSVVERFGELITIAETSEDLLRLIAEEPNRQPATLRTQLHRIFRRYVSPGTPVEMLKRVTKTEEIITRFSNRFRPIAELQSEFANRPTPDEALIALLAEYQDRGRKGYDLTDAFFTWFEAEYSGLFTLDGPKRAGQDVYLNDVLEGYHLRTPADIVIGRTDGTPLVVGFARYDSDRGGAQEDDRTGGNRDKVTEVIRYRDQTGIPVKVLFVNDGPGLLLGSMWTDYARLEEYGDPYVRVCTLKMLDARLTAEWLES